MEIKRSFLTASALNQMPSLFVFGADVGGIADAAQTALNLLGVKKNGFDVIKITPDDLKVTPSLFWDEASSMSLLASKRIIHLCNPSDTFEKELALYLQKPVPGVFVLVTSDSLNTKSAIYRLYKADAKSAALGCYLPSVSELKSLIQTVLSQQGLSIDSAALAQLAAYEGADRQVTLSDLDKLCVYMGDKKQVTLADVEALIGNNAKVSTDDVFFALLKGDDISVQRSIELLWQDGTNSVSLVRAVLTRMMQLLSIRAKVAKGADIDSASRSAVPFIPFAYKEAWRSALSVLSGTQIQNMIHILLETEKQMKSGLPMDLMAQRALLQLTEQRKKH